MFIQINDIDRNVYMISSIIKDGNKVIYKMINGTQLQEVFDTEEEAESKYEAAIEMTGGGGGSNIQYNTMPTAGAEFLDDIVQYTGETDSTYTKGYFYVCSAQGTDPETYAWEQINVQPGGSPSPVLPENGVRLLGKAARSVDALDTIQDAVVDDACLVLTDEEVEKQVILDFDYSEGGTAGTVLHVSLDDFNIPKLAEMYDAYPTVFEQLGAIYMFSTADLSHERLAFMVIKYHGSWYFLEHLSGSIVEQEGVINAWTCEDVEEGNFVHLNSQQASEAVGSLNINLVNYGSATYTFNEDFVFVDSFATDTSSTYTYEDIEGVKVKKEETITEIYKRSDLYTYDGTGWVYTDRNLSANANWEESDQTAPGYVRGRTHYVIPGAIENIYNLNLESLEDYESLEIDENMEYNPSEAPGLYVADFYRDQLVDTESNQYSSMLDSIKAIYDMGYTTPDNTFILNYGGIEIPVFVTYSDFTESNVHQTMCDINNKEFDINSDNPDWTAFKFGLHIERIVRGSDTPVYSFYLDILKDYYTEKDSLKVFNFNTRSGETVVKLDSKFIPQLADWNENNIESPKYIANRTHYREPDVEAETLVLNISDLTWEYETVPDISRELGWAVISQASSNSIYYEPLQNLYAIADRLYSSGTHKVKIKLNSSDDYIYDCNIVKQDNSASHIINITYYISTYNGLTENDIYTELENDDSGNNILIMVNGYKTEQV